MANDLENELRSIFLKQISTLSKAKKATEEGPREDDIPGFVLSNFWVHYTLGVSSLCNAVTKLAVLLTKAPLPDAATVKTCVMEIEASYMSMVNAFISIPKTEGTQLCKALGTATEAIITPLHMYFSKILKEPSDASQGEVLGVIWRSCEMISNLPKDNKAAVIQLVENEKELIKDALDELKEEIRGQKGVLKSGVVSVEENKGWTRGEIEVVQGGVTVVTTVHEALTKLLSCLSQVPSTTPTNVLDLLASTTILLSPALDDFISSLYPPIDLEPLVSQVEDVVNTMGTLLDLLSKFKLSKRSDDNWKEELRKKLEESQNEIHQLVASHEILCIESLSIQ